MNKKMLTSFDGDPVGGTLDVGEIVGAGWSYVT